MSKILVIAPHPDDEVLGCGGTIKKFVEAGNEAYLLVATKPLVPDWSSEYIENKEREIRASNEFLGFKKTFFLDLPALRLDTVAKKDLNDKLLNVVSEIQPEYLYIPFNGDINHDHRLVFESCLALLRPNPGLSLKKVLAYEISPTTELGMFFAKKMEDVFMPNYYEDISKFLEAKQKAMEFYRSELRDFPHPRSLKGIEILARKRGIECGVQAAEAFMLIREVGGKQDRFENWKMPEIKEKEPTKYGWMVQHVNNLRLGYKTDIGAFTYINAQNGVEIEDYVQIGSHCSVYSFSSIGEKHGKVILKKNCKIGSHSTIMPGVTVGENSIVGAHSFVNEDIPDNVLTYGVPARVIKKIDEK